MKRDASVVELTKPRERSVSNIHCTANIRWLEERMTEKLGICIIACGKFEILNVLHKSIR